MDDHMAEKSYATGGHDTTTHEGKLAYRHQSDFSRAHRNDGWIHAIRGFQPGCPDRIFA